MRTGPRLVPVLVPGGQCAGLPGTVVAGARATHAPSWTLPKNSVPAGSSGDRCARVGLLLLLRMADTHCPPDLLSARARARIADRGLPAAVWPLVAVGVEYPMPRSCSPAPCGARKRVQLRSRAAWARRTLSAAPTARRHARPRARPGRRGRTARRRRGRAPCGHRWTGPAGRAPAERLGHRHPRLAPQLHALARVVVGRLGPATRGAPGGDQDGPLPGLRHAVVGGVELARTRPSSPACGARPRRPATAAAPRGPARARPTRAGWRG